MPSTILGNAPGSRVISHAFILETHHQDSISLRGSPIGFGKALRVLTLDISGLGLSKCILPQLYTVGQFQFDF